MFLNYFVRKFRFWTKSRQNGGGSESNAENNVQKPEMRVDINYTLNKDLADNIETMKIVLGYVADLKVHPIKFGEGGAVSGALIFFDGMVDNPTLTDAILRPLTLWRDGEKEMPRDTELLEALRQEIICASDVKIGNTLDDLTSACLSGDTVLLVEGCAAGLCIDSKGFETRNITEPQSETVVRGPREGFTENLRTNTSLLRRKIKNGMMRVERMTAGRKTRTEICLVYIEGIADPKVVEKVRQRIGRLDVDAILESGYIEEYIEDAPFSPFATVAYSEKPDVVAAKILEGRTAIIIDGTPFVLTVPMLFIESFQTAEDYYSRPLYASLIRILRFIAFLITLFAPAIFIALTAFHQELLPTTLLFTIAKARAGTPFPILIEALIMVFAFEILREAGIRLPRPVGQAISIVGALIMGDAAVSAGLVGAPMVITVGITAVAGFLVPTQNDSCSILRLIMMFLAAFAGWYGISMGFLGMLIHLASLDSFGIPFFDSFAHADDLQDTIVRAPLWAMVKRPRDIARNDTTRVKFFIPPMRPYSPDQDDMPENK